MCAPCVLPAGVLCPESVKSAAEGGALCRAHQLCVSRGGRPGLPVPNKPGGFCGRKQHWNETTPCVFANSRCRTL